MSNIVIHPVCLTEIDHDKSVMTYQFNMGKRITIGGYIWYIERAGEQILVDAGGDAEYMLNKKKHLAREIQTIGAGLGKFGISPEDIDLVILTHLHHDHVAFASRFPKARFLVQSDELEFARNPHPMFSMHYEMKFFEGLEFEVINGDVKISQDISVIKTPGHTPGGQSVCIRTAQGNVVISGLCTISDSFKPPSSVAQPVVISLPHTSPFEAYDSLLRIKEMADIILPLHDISFRNVRDIP